MINEIFNSREIATLIWLLIAFIYLLYRGIRSSLKTSVKNIFESATHIKILIPLLASLIYTLFAVFFLQSVSLWDISLIKDSFYWYIFAGVPLIFKVTGSRNQVLTFKRVILENFKLLLIVEFLANFYTFHVVAELLLVPFLFFISIFGVHIQSEKNNESLLKLVNKLEVVVGLVILVYAGFELIQNYQEFFSFLTLKSFLLPIFLTFLYLPFLYLLVLYSNYEILFMRLNLGAEKTDEIKLEAKKEILKRCHLSVRKTNNANNMNLYNLMSIRSLEDVKEMGETYRKKL